MKEDDIGEVVEEAIEEVNKGLYQLLAELVIECEKLLSHNNKVINIKEAEQT